MDRFTQLYTLGLEKPKYEGKKQDTVVFERDPKAYTFKPDLSLTKGKSFIKQEQA